MLLLVPFCLLVGCSVTDSLLSIVPAGDPSLALDSAAAAIPLAPLLGEGTARGGLLSGHFDLDTSSRVYAFSKGETDRHVHEYDDKYAINGADFFRLLDDRLREVPELVASPSTRFVILIGNGQLSLGAALDINGELRSAYLYQRKLLEDLQKGISPQAYTLGDPLVAGDKRLSRLKVSFPVDTISKGGLLATATDCVQRNDPGRKGEYRNGALIVQIVSADALRMDPGTGVQALAQGSGMIWEATLFWHKSSQCY